MAGSTDEEGASSSACGRCSFGVLFSSCVRVCVSLSGVLFSVGVCVCDLLIFSTRRRIHAVVQHHPQTWPLQDIHSL